MRSAALVPLVAAACLWACSPGAEPAAPAPAPAPASAPQIQDPTLATAIAAFLGDDADTTRTVVRIVGEGEGRVALVYLLGMNWCGTGGCNLLVLRPGAAGWEQVGNISRVGIPVRVLTTASHGLPDIGVTVSGGGGPPAYEAKMSFDGRTYPHFPSDEPLVGAEGTVVIADVDTPAPAE